MEVKPDHFVHWIIFAKLWGYLLKPYIFLFFLIVIKKKKHILKFIILAILFFLALFILYQL